MNTQYTTPIVRSKRGRDQSTPENNEKLKKVNTSKTPDKMEQEGASSKQCEKSTVELLKSMNAPEYFQAFANILEKKFDNTNSLLSEFKEKTNEEISYLKRKSDEQEARIKELETRIMQQETYSRKNNLIIDGIQASEKEDLYVKLDKFFEKELSISEKIQVSICHRLGKSEKFRPAAVIVKFVYLRQRNIVWEAREATW